MPVLESVINISEGRDLEAIATIGRSAGTALLDVHTDAYHHRSVLTVAGVRAARSVASATLRTLNLRHHAGVHPRIGVLDVVPFVPLGGSTMADAELARNEMGVWLAETFNVPVFLYGHERTLPDIRREAFGLLTPDFGPATAHVPAGACAVGCRPLLVAYNVWLEGATLAEAKRIASCVRRPGIRALGLQVGNEVQVSMNLIDPVVVRPDHAFDLVAAEAPVRRAELVGLVPAAIVQAINPTRWSELDLDPSRTIEARLTHAGLSI